MRVPAGLVSGEDSSPLSDSCPLTVLSHRGVGVWRGESSLWCLRAPRQGLSLVMFLIGSLPEPCLQMPSRGVAASAWFGARLVQSALFH